MAGAVHGEREAAEQPAAAAARGRGRDHPQRVRVSRGPGRQGPGHTHPGLQGTVRRIQSH